jgi:four helix bundle protein
VGSKLRLERVGVGVIGAPRRRLEGNPNLGFRFNGLKRQDVFDFEKLEVYQEMRGVNLKVLKHLFTQKADLDPYLQDQFKRASLSALLNLAEGTGRMTSPDKKKFYITARSSVFECVAILQIMFDTNAIEKSLYEELYTGFEKISRMLLGMIRSME